MVNTDAIAAVLKRAADSGDVPGVVFAAATRDGQIFEGGFGKRDLATGAPMAADTVVWIASMTKAITCACAMQQVERGKLELDAPIKAGTPRPEGARSFDADGQPKTRRARRDIALRHLFTHTSGYAYDFWNADVMRYMEKTGTPGSHFLRERGADAAAVAEPGGRWEYGVGIDWAGKAVEAVTGKKLGQAMRDEIFDPLGMKDTGFRIGEAQRRRLAKIHVRTPDGLVATDTEIPHEPEFEMGGGGLYGTVGDYLKFAQVFLHGGTFNGVQILKPETVKLMGGNAAGEVRVRPLKTAQPPISNDVDFIDGMHWGLSFLISLEPLPTGRSAGSLAWAGLANSYYWIDPAKGVAGVYATQILPFFDEKSVPTFQTFETEVYRAT